MLLFYVDECGDAKAWPAAGSKGSRPSDYFVLAAVGISDTSRQNAAEALTALRAKHLHPPAGATPTQWKELEIKGRYLAQAARALMKGAQPSRAVFRPAFTSETSSTALLHSLRNIFNRYRPLIFVVAIDKKRLAELDRAIDPLGAAYAILHERVAQTLGGVVAGEAAIFVADQQLEHEAYFRDGHMKTARDAMASRLHSAPDFNRVLDKPLWIDPELSEWDREIIQLADIVAYSTYELVKRNSAPTEDYYLWEAIEPWLARHWGSGKVAGGGLAVFPPPKRYPTLIGSHPSRSPGTSAA